MFLFAPIFITELQLCTMQWLFGSMYTYTLSQQFIRMCVLARIWTDLNDNNIQQIRLALALWFRICSSAFAKT